VEAPCRQEPDRSTLTRRRAFQTGREEVAVTAGSKRWFTGLFSVALVPAAVADHDLTAKGEKVNG